MLDLYIGPILYAQPPEINGGTRRNLQSLLGATLIAIGLIIVNKEKFFPGWWALLPTIGTVLIISAGLQAWFNRTILSSRLLVWFGLISFPLYLWHWPLLSFARIVENETPSREIRLCAILISILLAWLTYQFVEKSIRFGEHSKTKVIVLLTLMFTIGYVGYYTKEQGGFASRFTELEQKRASLFNSSNERWTWTQTSCVDKYAPQYDTAFCLTNDLNNPPEIMLIGDSHSNHLYPGIANKHSNVLNLAAPGCIPFFNVGSTQKGIKEICASLINKALKFAIDNESVKTVILASRGPLYLTGKGFSEKELDYVMTLINRPEISDTREMFAIAMKSTLEQLLAKNKNVIFVIDNPELGFDVSQCVDTRPLRLTAKHTKNPCAVSKQSFDERNREYRELVFSVLKNFPAVHIFDTAEKLCDENLCWAIKDGKILYRDDEHLSLQGSEFMAQKLRNAGLLNFD